MLTQIETIVADADGRPEQTDITVPTRSESRQAAREEHGEDVDEATVEAFHETAMREWESRVRANLRDRVRVAHDPRTGDEVWADVRYE